jgi:hypothetical protein
MCGAFSHQQSRSLNAVHLGLDPPPLSLHPVTKCKNLPWSSLLFLSPYLAPDPLRRARIGCTIELCSTQITELDSAKSHQPLFGAIFVLDWRLSAQSCLLHPQRFPFAWLTPSHLAASRRSEAARCSLQGSVIYLVGAERINRQHKAAQYCTYSASPAGWQLRGMNFGSRLGPESSCVSTDPCSVDPVHHIQTRRLCASWPWPDTVFLLHVAACLCDESAMRHGTIYLMVLLVACGRVWKS